MKELNAKINKTISNNINKIRTDKKYNKKIVSDISKIEYPTYFKIEANLKTISAVEIIKLSTCLDVDVNEFFEGTKELFKKG